MLDAVAMPLFAAGIDWLEGLLPLLFVVFWIVSQIVGVIRRVAGAGRPKQPEPLRPVPRPLADGGPAAAGGPRSELERQVEEFLKRSGGGPPPRPRQTKPTPPRPVERPRQREVMVRRDTAPVPAAREKPVAERHLRSIAADGDVAKHVHDAFDQKMAHLESPLAAGELDADGRPVLQSPASPVELTKLLRNPLALRQLILLREVLDRPVERW
ncbi:MAG: hypothetical protein K8S94_00470 [Planctomycetia bacterium]|nr:hypothetical protein [Planctomycetia bacterium]